MLVRWMIECQYRNTPERLFARMAESRGWDITKRGWPDFLCWRDGKLVAVEVKPRGSHPLKASQLRVMRYLVAHGIDCYKWSPDGGFEKIEPEPVVCLSGVGL
jgi:hypothetical protein